MLENMMPLKEWAAREGIDPATARQKILRGQLEAVKVGRDWWIDKDIKNIDHRKKPTT